MGSNNENIDKPLLGQETIWRFGWLLCYLFLGLQFMIGSARAENDPFAERSVRIGFNFQSFSDFDRPDIETALTYLGEEIGNHAGIPTTIRFYGDIADMRNDFELGRINLVATSPWLITQYFKRESLADAVRPSMDDASLDQLLLLTRRDQGITELKDLRNKRLGLVDNYTITKMYLDNLTLKHFSRHYRQVFKNISYYEKSRLLLLGLFFKKVDAIVIFKASYDIAVQMNPQVGEQLQVLDSMPGFPWGIMYFHKNVDPGFREFMISHFLAMKEDVKGKHFLQMLKSTQLVRSSLADLESIDALNTEYSQLLRKYK